MGGVILSLLSTLWLSVNVVLSSSAVQQNLLPGNFTGLIHSSIQNTNSQTLWSPKLLPYQITNKKSYAKGSDKEANPWSNLDKKMKKWLKKRKKTIDFIPDEMVIISDTPTPIIDQSFPAYGSIPEDGCDSSSVKFDDGKCYPLMGRKPCNDPRQWVTVNPKTFKGECTPRHCGRDRVFVVRTGLCHDIYDTSECQGGRRLYYSPYGDAVCDCPVGYFPYPNPRDDCFQLFTQGPCPYGQVLTISENILSCRQSLCLAESPPTYIDNNYSQPIEILPTYDVKKYDSQSNIPLVTIGKYHPKPLSNRPMVPTNDGKCSELGTSDPCQSYDDSQLLGLDILKNELECVDVTNSSSPYYSSQEEDKLIDSYFPQLYPEYDPLYLVYVGTEYENVVHHDKKKKKVSFQKKFSKRQFSGRAISVPSNPSCRPGSGQGKCNDKLIPSSQNRETKQAVKSALPTNCGNLRYDPRTRRCS